jgi:alanine racemase
VRPTRAEIDLEAVAHNVAALCERAAPAELLAVVKADGYGHGAVEVAQAALGAGASRLGVALVEEGQQLRDAGIEAPILVLSEPSPPGMADLVRNGLTATLYSEVGIDAAVTAVQSAARREPLAVHLKVDTGMRRVGADPDDAVELAERIASRGELVLESVWTHCAVADEPDNPFTATQLERYEQCLAQLEDAGLRPRLCHAANSAGTIAVPAARYDLVRCGISIYGIPPAPALAGMVDLRPAMRLVSEVSFTKAVGAGEGVSYGHRFVTDRPTVLATVPIGYADGVRRSLGLEGGEVLIGGARRPIVGVVTMDQLLVDCGPPDGGGAPVEVGDEVVLIVEQGDERITAEEIAQLLGTIGYEIVCDVGPRVPRVYRRSR